MSVAKNDRRGGTTGKTIIPRERLDLVERLYLKGKSRTHIAEKLFERFGTPPRTARRYIARVEAKLAALPKPPPGAAFARAESMLIETYGIAKRGVRRVVVSQGAGRPAQVEEFPEADTAVMATVAYRLAELCGAAPSKKVDVTSGGEKVALTIYAPPEQEP